MAITADSVYSGSQMTQYNPLPMGFYFSGPVACTNAAETIMDDAMSTTADVKVNVRAHPSVRTVKAYDFIIYIDGTAVGVITSDTAYTSSNSEGLDFIVPKGVNLKVTGDNQTDSSSVNCQTYVTITELMGSTSA